MLSKIAKTNTTIDLATERDINRSFSVEEEESLIIYIHQKIFALYSEETYTLDGFEGLLNLIRNNENKIDAENAKYFFSYV